MPQAESKEEFIQAWQSHINQLYKIGESLPNDEADDFLDAVEEVEDFVKVAADNTFDSE